MPTLGALTRIPVTTQVTLTHLVVVDGALSNASGAVTATLRRPADGTAVDGPTTCGNPSTGVYTYSPPAQADVNLFWLDWSGLIGGTTVVVRDFVEIVGGFLFSISAARNLKPALDATKYPDDLLVAHRVEVETVAERITNVALVPRYKRRRLDGTGRPELVCPDLFLRTLRSAAVGGTALTSGELSDVDVTDSGLLVRRSGAAWPAGRGNVIVEYEHGFDYPPADCSSAGILHLRSLLSRGNQATPYRAVSFTFGEGGVYRMSMPGPDRTGIPEVDAAYMAYRQDSGGFA